MDKPSTTEAEKIAQSKTKAKLLVHSQTQIITELQSKLKAAEQLQQQIDQLENECTMIKPTLQLKIVDTNELILKA